MTNIAPLDPQASLEGGQYKPNQYMAAPTVNAVDKVGMDSTTTPGKSLRSATGIGGANVDWLGMSRQAYQASESWLQVNMRQQWARSFAHYRSEHSPDSPLLAEANKYRAKYFWPKTRTLVRDIQAAAAAAYFTSSDVVAIEAQDSDNPLQLQAASFIKELTNYRLTHTIPWYQIVLGGIQEAAVMGTVASHQSWSYKEVEMSRVVGEDVDGKPIYEYFTEVVEDQLQVRIVPVENIRISPAADWLDPANSSPYFIELIPMYIGDVMARIRQGDSEKTGEPAWRNIGEGALLGSGSRDNIDPTRRARAGNRRLDPKANMMETINDFRIVWIHRNIVRHDGIDWLYYTAGVNALLSEPVPLQQIIPWAGGKRDYVLGKMEIETDRPYPSGPVELASGMQKAINELKNQRYDNVRQVLNRRYLYRAGNQVDARALSRNIPGGLISVAAPGPLDSHVTPLPVQDVTSSAYQEEDRLSLAMDDLTGSTTGSTVNSNRKLHETATGMNLMAEAGNKVREMEMRTFTETWMEPVLRQVVQLIAMYETDEIAMTVAAGKLKLLSILPEFFNQTFAVSVNVGMGAVSPQQRLQKIQTAVATVTQLVPDAAMAIQGPEVAKEVFGAAGYDNGARFFDFAKVEELKKNQQPDPAQQLAQQQLEQKYELEKAKLQLEQGKLQLEQAKAESAKQLQDAKINEIMTKVDLILSQVDLTKAKATNEKVTSIYEAAQTAGVVVQNPATAAVTDEILNSAGFVDSNGGTVVPAPEEMAPAQVFLPEPTQTSPALPAAPASANRGILRGIETTQLESNT